MSRLENYPRHAEAERIAMAQLGGRNQRFAEDMSADEDEHFADGSIVSSDGNPEECELCKRDGLELTRHHLIPRSRHRKARSKRQFTRDEMRSRIAHICQDCHSHIHTLFTEKELAANYNTLEDLRGHEGMQKFVVYIRKQR